MKVSLSFDLDYVLHADIARVIGEIIETMVYRNRLYLRSNPKTPLFYEAGIRYVPASAEERSWRDIPGVLKKRQGDCKDLVPWRLAELREKGEEAQAHVVIYENDALYHVQVRRPNGVLEDPSRRLGMGSLLSVVRERG